MHLSNVKLKSQIRLATLAVFAWLASGCGSLPPGFTKSQWDQMPAEEKAAYRRLDNRQALRAGREMERQTADAIKKAEAAHEVFPLDRAHLSAK